MQALEEVGVVDVAVCGLAKRLEEVWLPGDDSPVILPRTSEGLYLLQRVRDEAHRFAITYHRKKRSAALTVSELDGIPGLGPARRATLLRHFGSVRKLRAATEDEIAALPGFGLRTAQAIHAALHEAPPRPSTSISTTGGRHDVPGWPVTAGDEASPEIVIITGLSGAGRSTAAKSLEDLDWFVADNIPADLLPTMADLARRAKGGVPRLAAVVDVRSRAFSTDLKSAISDLYERGVRPYTVFLEASDETLVRRFDSVSRPHPLQEGGRVVDGIAAERELLQPLRAEADLILDTSALNVHELRARMRYAFAAEGDSGLRITVVSFGFKYGLPVDADMVADCRFLPNPHWIPELAPLTGQDRPVREYVLGQSGAADFLDAYVRAVRVALAGVRPHRPPFRGPGRRLHRRQAPQRGHVRGDRGPAGRLVAGRAGHAPGSRARVADASSAQQGGCPGRRPWPAYLAIGAAPGDPRPDRRRHGGRRRRLQWPPAPGVRRPAAR